MTTTAPGSPARAGIDLSVSGLMSSWMWFPRTRGDRPKWVTYSGEKARVPPHARG